MLLVSIEGVLIDNIVILEDKLLFSDSDENEDVVYSSVPVNEYVENTDYYNKVQVYLYDEDYLNFNDEEGLAAFKDECLNQFEKGNDSFTYNNLKVFLQEIPDQELKIK